MKKAVITCVALLCLGFTACTKKESFGCKLEQSVVTGLSDATAMALACDHPDAIQKDVIQLAEKVNICKAPPQTTNPRLGPAVCGVVSKMLIDQAVKLLPAAWGCKGGLVAIALQAPLATACMAIPIPSP